MEDNRDVSSGSISSSSGTNPPAVEAAFDPEPSLASSELIVSKLTKLVTFFSAHTPSRATIRQIFAFLTFAEGDVKGAPLTMSNLRDMALPEARQAKIFDTALTRSFDIFMAPKNQGDDALDWLYQQPDTVDQRRKYIRLTEKGREAYKAMLDCLN